MHIIMTLNTSSSKDLVLMHTCNKGLVNPMLTSKQIKTLKKKRFLSLYEFMDEMDLPSHSWAGADTFVWDLGDFVLKLSQIQERHYATLKRLVASRGSPIVPVRELRLIGQMIFNSRQKLNRTLVILMLQDKVAVAEDYPWTPIRFYPTTWTDDDGQMWEQHDPHDGNLSLDGKWIDLLSIKYRGIVRNAYPLPTGG